MWKPGVAAGAILAGALAGAYLLWSHFDWISGGESMGLGIAWLISAAIACIGFVGGVGGVWLSFGTVQDGDTFREKENFFATEFLPDLYHGQSFCWAGMQIGSFVLIIGALLSCILWIAGFLLYSAWGNPTIAFIAVVALGLALGIAKLWNRSPRGRQVLGILGLVLLVAALLFSLVMLPWSTFFPAAQVIFLRDGLPILIVIGGIAGAIALYQRLRRTTLYSEICPRAK